eukprot:TRINITY_DN2076_c0_g1_i1.p1 TRINITY_DN2076_c0_g1~~TRINITY_DN2076_c0_g1_i1.p1  ORF type:complete len:274 (-),score=41.08 TRINITY_DN2076_c0_g1_i1:21-842(-)
MKGVVDVPDHLEIQTYFETWGEIRTLLNGATSNEKIIEFYDIRDAEQALKQADGADFEGGTLVVSAALPIATPDAPDTHEQGVKHWARQSSHNRDLEGTITSRRSNSNDRASHDRSSSDRGSNDRRSYDRGSHDRQSIDRPITTTEANFISAFPTVMPGIPTLPPGYPYMASYHPSTLPSLAALQTPSFPALISAAYPMGSYPSLQMTSLASLSQAYPMTMPSLIPATPFGMANPYMNQPGSQPLMQPMPTLAMPTMPAPFNPYNPYNPKPAM